MESISEDQKEYPNASIQVIACGLPRTGTTTMGRALSMLLDNGPVLDGVNDTFLFGSTSDQNDFITLSSLPKRDNRIKPLLHKILTINKPYVATTDSPFPFYLEELVAMYPHVRCVRMVRDPDGWVKSFQKIHWTFTLLAPYAILWNRLRRCTVFMENMWTQRMQEHAIEGQSPTRTKLLQSPVLDQRTLMNMWQAHEKYVEAVVPSERLLVMDVREGWKPLCEFLGKEIPKTKVWDDQEKREIEVEVPFPHEFSGDTVTQERELLIRRLRGRLTSIVLGGVVMIGAAWALRMWYVSG